MQFVNFVRLNDWWMNQAWKYFRFDFRFNFSFVVLLSALVIILRLYLALFKFTQFVMEKGQQKNHLSVLYWIYSDLVAVMVRILPVPQFQVNALELSWNFRGSLAAQWIVSEPKSYHRKELKPRSIMRREMCD